MSSTVDIKSTGAAAYEVWRTMLAKALVQGHNHTQDNHPGYILRGSGIKDAILSLWSFTPTDSIDTIMARLRNSLKEHHNVICLIQRRGNTTEEWWVAKHWTPVYGYEPPVEPLPELGSTSAPAEQSDAVAAVLGSIDLIRDNVTQQIKQLEEEVEYQRMKIITLSSALKGLIAFLDDEDPMNLNITLN